MERIPALSRLLPPLAVVGSITVALAVFCRRAVRAPLRDLAPGEAAVYVGLFTLVSATAIRLLVPADRPRLDVTTAIATLLSVVFAAGLTTEPTAILVCVLTAVVMAALVSVDATYFADACRSVDDTPYQQTTTREVAPATACDPPNDFETDDESTSEPTAVVHLDRTTERGRERLAGAIRFQIPAGQTLKTLHVPIWPPLPAAPVVRCELEGLDGRVCTAFAKPYGLRIEVRLSETADEPLAGTVRFVAEQDQRAAA